jgi:hypothetical protein
MKVHDDGSAGGEYSPSIDVAGEDAAIIAMAPDLAAEVLRLTTERDAVVAANRQLVARDAEVRRLIGLVLGPSYTAMLDWQNADRAFLAGDVP